MLRLQGHFFLWVLVALTAMWPSASDANPERKTAMESPLLQIPSLGSQAFPPGILNIPRPEIIRRLVVHIPGKRVPKVFLRINTTPLGIIQDTRQLRDKATCRVSFERHGSSIFDLEPENNTIEVKLGFSGDSEPTVARWVITPPAEESWKDGRELRPEAAATMSSEPVRVFEKLAHGLRRELEYGLTTEDRIYLQVGFQRFDSSIGVRARWQGAAGESRVFMHGDFKAPASSRGTQPKATSSRSHLLEVPVDLELGTNRLEVTVFQGRTEIYRSHLDVFRRKPTRPVDVEGRRWAVVMGISTFEDSRITPLRYAHSDALEIERLLVEKGGFAPENVRVLTNESATQRATRSALFDFLTQTQRDDLVLIYLAGHGVPDPKDGDNFYFLTHDSRVDDLGGTAIPLWDLNTAMGHSIRAEQILVMADTCHSGGVLDYRMVDAFGTNFVNKYLENIAKQKGKLILTASQAHEQSIEKDYLGHGAFTFHVLEGLRGAADLDRNHVVTVQEVIDYVREAVPEETQGRQHPVFKTSGFDLGLGLSYLHSNEEPSP